MFGQGNTLKLVLRFGEKLVVEHKALKIRKHGSIKPHLGGFYHALGRLVKDDHVFCAADLPLISVIL